MDLVVTAVAVPFVVPLMLLAAAATYWTLGRPVIFAQIRPGKNGTPFTMYKFRTMTSATDMHGQLLPDAQRLTRVGRLLRRLSIDELPELLNVLKGEMSLVGPRPLSIKYLSLYNSSQARRHEVLPGITGLAQVRGRNALSWEERFELDVWYVDHRSVLLDLRILCTTVLVALGQDGVMPDGQSAVRNFAGSKTNGGDLIS